MNIRINIKRKNHKEIKYSRDKELKIDNSLYNYKMKRRILFEKQHFFLKPQKRKSEFKTL